MRKLIVANWKLYVTKNNQAEKLLSVTKHAHTKYPGSELVVCPPFILVPMANNLLKGSGVKVGAQNLFWGQHGAFTGEVGTHILKDYGVHFVIVGHSERRYMFDETDAIVAKKLHAALQDGLTAILCVGERARIGNWKRFLTQQVRASTKGLTPKYLHNLVIAYEPVWAIGTDKADTPADAEEAIGEIKKVLAKKFGKKVIDTIRMLYGGSVTSANIRSFLVSPQIDGALIGRASTDPKDFAKIIAIASGF